MPSTSGLDDSAIVESEEVAPGVVLDYNDADQVVGIEMLYLSKRSPNLNLSTLGIASARPADPPLVPSFRDEYHLSPEAFFDARGPGDRPLNYGGTTYKGS